MDDSSVIDGLARHREGDPLAGPHLLGFLLPRLKRFLEARTGGDTALAEDLVQEAAWRVWRGLPTCEARSVGQLTSWAMTVAARALLDHRGAAPPPGLVLPWEDGWEDVSTEAWDRPIGDPVIREAAAAGASEALRLPGRTGWLLWARLIDGASWGEVAHALGTTPGAAKRRYQRALHRLAHGVRAAILPQLSRPPPAWLRAHESRGRVAASRAGSCPESTRD